MLGKCGIISEAECDEICGGLEAIYGDVESGALEIKDAEDIHSFVENELVARIGDSRQKLHTARSRNDQVATDFRLYVRNACDNAVKALCSLVESLTDKAESGLKYVMPGYTHLRKAQPMCAGHFFNAYAGDVPARRRQICRVEKAYERYAAGAAARLRGLRTP